MNETNSYGPVPAPEARRGGTAVVVRLFSALLIVASVGCVLFASPIKVHADDSDCVTTSAGINMPSFLVGEEGLTYGLAGAPIVGAGSSLLPTSGGAVLTAGTSAAGGVAAVEAALLMGAAMVAYGEGACFFLDVVNADRYVASAICTAGGLLDGVFGGHGFVNFCSQPAPVGAKGRDTVTYGDLDAASGLSATQWPCAGAGYGPSGLTGQVFRKRCLTFDTELGGSLGDYRWYVPDGVSGFAAGALYIPPFGAEVQASYALPEVDATSPPGYVRARFAANGNTLCALEPAIGTGSSNTNCVQHFGQTEISIAVRCRTWYDADMSGGGYNIAEDVGGACGQPPGQVLIYGHRTNTTVPIHLVTTFFPEAQDGWWRRYVTDAYCLNLGTEVGTWRRYDGAQFLDTGETTARPSVGRCLEGEAPAEVVVTKVPANVSCASGVVCWPNSLVSRVAWPSEWISDPPPFAPCLAVGNVCNPAGPQIEVDTETSEEICVWEPSVVIDITYCAGGKVDLGGVVDGGLTTTEVVDVSETPVGDPTSTGTPVDVLDPKVDPTPTPDPNGPTIIVNIPIDDGGEETPRVICPVGGGGDESGPCIPEDDADCWDSGWGWFNPATWILVPIKCAIEWAFVPDFDMIAEAWGDLRDSAEAHAPFSWFWAGFDAGKTVLLDLDTAIEAHDDDCFDWLPAFDSPYFPYLKDGAEICLQGIMSSPMAQELRGFAGDGVWIAWALAVAVSAVRIWGVGKTEVLYTANSMNPGGV